MKKLLLATVVFMSMGLMASAQQKKSAVKAPMSLQPETTVTASERKANLKAVKQEKNKKRTELQIARENNSRGKRTAVKPATPATN